jgi:hypothetical protein
LSKNNLRSGENAGYDANPFLTGENVMNSSPIAEPEEEIEMTP